MFDFRYGNEKVTGIVGQIVTATKMGKKKVLFIQVNDKVTECIIIQVKYCPNIKARLISITSKISKEGVKLSSDDQENIILTYPNGNEMIFDHCTKFSSGWVPSIDVVTNTDKITKL